MICDGQANNSQHAESSTLEGFMIEDFFLAGDFYRINPQS
jgi:hypothetical protein